MLVLETMDLNWRDAPPTGEIIKRISNLFTDLDQHKQVSLCLANSTAKDAVGLYKQWDGASLIKRRNKAVSICNSILPFFQWTVGTLHG